MITLIIFILVCLCLIWLRKKAKRKVLADRIWTDFADWEDRQRRKKGKRK